MSTSPIRRDVKLGTPAALPTETHLAIADGIRINEWLEIGAELEKLGDSSAWWIGDWLAYGDCYRRDYHAIIRQTEERWSTARVYRWVSQRVTPDRRVRGLSWSHHQAVAALEPDEQTEWLLDAQTHGWTRAELRDRIAGRKQTDARPPALQLKATGRLYDLCSRAAAARGIPPAQWAHQALEQAALHDLGDIRPLAPTEA